MIKKLYKFILAALAVRSVSGSSSIAEYKPFPEDVLSTVIDMDGINLELFIHQSLDMACAELQHQIDEKQQFCQQLDGTATYIGNKLHKIQQDRSLGYSYALNERSEDMAFRKTYQLLLFKANAACEEQVADLKVSEEAQLCEAYAAFTRTSSPSHT